MTRKFDRESVLKGEILWRKLLKVYNEETEETHRVNAPFTKIMDLFSSPRRETNKPPVSVSVYSDGAGLGNYNSHTGKGLTGYGYGFIGFQEGRVFHPSVLRSEYKFNPATITEAEALGALKGVQHAKAAIRKKGGESIRFTLSTDSLDVIRGLHDMPSVLRKIKEITDTPREQRSNHVRNKYNELVAIRNLANELYNDPLVENVKTKWVKGHILDSTPMQDLRCVEDYLNHKISESTNYDAVQKYKVQRLLFHDMRNNKMVDKAALEGAVTSLTKRIDFLACEDYSDTNVQRKAIQTSIAIMNSTAARRIATEYIASKPVGYVNDHALTCLFGETGIDDIKKKREKLCGAFNCTEDQLPQAVIDANGHHFQKRVIDDYTSKKEVSFIRKFGALEVS